MVPVESERRSGQEVLVIGGGIAGITAALEAAEAGCSVILIEKEPYLGGRVAKSHLYFPKLCPPGCGLEINFRRIKINPRIQVSTQTELERLEGIPGSYLATLRFSPRHVTSDCTLCGACAEACPAERPDTFNEGLSKTRAAYLPFSMAFPARYAIDRSACKDGCLACEEACKYHAVDLAQQETRKTILVSSVVLATGWKPYDAARIENLGFGRYPNVLTNVLVERLAAVNGPSGGKLLRPSDGSVPRRVAFIQCAGSRDQNHLPYCSSVCCTASLKQCTYFQTLLPDTQITVFYIDIRTPGRLEEFLTKVTAAGSIQLVKGKVARIEEDALTKDLIVHAEDILHGKRLALRFDLVVLATGIVPQTSGLPAAFTLDEFGFATGGADGLCAAGCVKRPEDVSASVRDAASAALKSLQSAVGSVQHG